MLLLRLVFYLGLTFPVFAESIHEAAHQNIALPVPGINTREAVHQRFADAFLRFTKMLPNEKVSDFLRFMESRDEDIRILTNPSHIPTAERDVAILNRLVDLIRSPDTDPATLLNFTNKMGTALGYIRSPDSTNMYAAYYEARNEVFRPGYITDLAGATAKALAMRAPSPQLIDSRSPGLLATRHTIVPSMEQVRIWFDNHQNDQTDFSQILLRHASKPLRFDGYQLDIEVRSPEDILALAKKYSAGRDPQQLESLMRQRLERNGGPVWIPLEDLLPSFVRNKLNSFENCSGPDCAFSALSFHNNYSPEQRAWLPIPFEFDYLPVALEDARVGDIISYWRQWSWGTSELIHLAVSVGDGYVFTKNGASELAPYMFQLMIEVEQIYGKFDAKTRKIHRPKP